MRTEVYRLCRQSNGSSIRVLASVENTPPDPESIAAALRRLKKKLEARLEDAAEGRRHALSAKRSGKRDAYLLKAELAVKAELGDAAAIALLATEAAARGIDEPTLRAVILAKRTSWMASAMAIETAEASAKATIAAAPDGPAAVAAADAGIAALEAIG